MRKSKSSPHQTRLRGSVTQNRSSNVSVRMRTREAAGVGFLARLGVLMGCFVLFVIFMLWLWHTGWPQEKIHALEDDALIATQKIGFSVKDVAAQGLGQSSKADVLDAIGVKTGEPIFGFDTHEAAERLGKLPWVGSAIVERRLPDRVVVVLAERQPAARWQHDDKFYVIDNQGQVLPSAKAEDFGTLPLFVGTGAATSAQDLMAMLKPYPEITSKMESAVRVGERRWDLHLIPRVTVRLPEQDTAAAIHRLSVLINQEKILERDIVAVDLRIPDRLVLEPAGDKKP